MKRRLRIIGIVLAVIVVATIALPFGLNVNTFRPKLEAALSSALGRQVSVGNLSLSFFVRTVSAQDISIADDAAFGGQPFIRANSLKVGVEILPLIFSKSLHVTELTLEKPEITLIRSAEGTWNFSSLGESTSNPAPESSTPGTPPPTGNATPSDLAVKKLDIKDGRVTISHADSDVSHVYDSVNIAVRNFSFTSQFPFNLSATLPGGGSLKLDGTAGPINPTDASLTPLQAQIDVKHLDLELSGIAELAPGMSGVADFDGTVGCDGQQLRTSGTLQADQLKLVQNGSPAGRPVQVKYSVEHELHTQAGTLTQGDVTMGRAVAQLTGGYQVQGQSAVLDMKLDAQGMPVDDLEAMLPALGVVLPSGSRLRGGTLSANLTITGSSDAPVIAGPLRLSNSKLAGFDLGSKLSVIKKLGAIKTGTDTSIQNLSVNAHVAQDGVRTENVNLTVPALGTLTGSGTIAPGGALEYKMTATLSGAAATTLTKMIGLGDQAQCVPFFIRGTTSNPTFVPDLKGLVKCHGQDILNAVKSHFGQKTPPGPPQPAAPTKRSIFDKLKDKLHRKKNN